MHYFEDREEQAFEINTKFLSGLNNLILFFGEGHFFQRKINIYLFFNKKLTWCKNEI